MAFKCDLYAKAAANKPRRLKSCQAIATGPVVTSSKTEGVLSAAVRSDIEVPML